LTIMIVFLSINPVMNMISKNQIMNTSFSGLRIVNTYGAFGSVGKVRREVILEGTTDTVISDQTQWREFEFKCKPGDVSRRPCIMSPYHYRIDWQIWFAAMSPYWRQPWLLNFMAKLLQQDPPSIGLIDKNPFDETNPPKFIRALLYEYRFTTPEEKHETGDWWVRKLLGKYAGPVSLDSPTFKSLLEKQGWS